MNKVTTVSALPDGQDLGPDTIAAQLVAVESVV